MSKSTLTVGLVQQANSGDEQANIEKSLRGIAECAARGAQLVVLQELHCGLYFCQSEDTTRFDFAFKLFQ